MKDWSFSDTWTVDEIISQLGSIDHAPTVKALNVWVAKGVLSEEVETQYRLLETSQNSSNESIRPMGTSYVLSLVSRLTRKFRRGRKPWPA